MGLVVDWSQCGGNF